MNAAELLVAALEGEGVEYVFGLPGEETEDLLFALRDSSITFVPVRHEQGAAFMADVHGRLTGDAGVCLSTLGPGATNLLTGVADAHLDKSPVVAVTGQGGLGRLHQESHQAIDVVDMFGPITKWNAQLDDPDIVHEAVRKAFKLSEREKPGATHLELPENVAAAETEKRPMEPSTPTQSRPADAAVRRCLDLLEDADRPLVVAGNGAVRSGNTGDIRRFVEATGVPVVSTYMGKGVVSDDDPRSLMTLASGDGDEASAAVEDADLLLAVGYDVAEHDPGSWNRSQAAPLVHVDTEPAEVYEQYDPSVELVGDVGASMAELTERLPGDVSFDVAWYADYRERIRESVAAVDDGATAPFTVSEAVSFLREALAPEDVLVVDVGSHKMTIAEEYPTRVPNTCVVSNGLASMGIAVPGAIAGDLAVEGNVVAATGDGGFLMNAAELETAVRIGCGVTVVVFEDADYGLISEKQCENRGEHFGTEFTNPDLVAFGESFGIEAHRPGTGDELRAALQTVADDEVSLIVVAVA